MGSRFVIVEKFNNSFIIRILPEDLIDENLVWYYSYKNEFFRVRNPSYREIKEAECDVNFYKEYKERLLIKGFYVVTDDTVKNGCWIGKCDARIVKRLWV